MSKSARRPQQLYTIVMWALSIIFAGFLIGFGGLLIRDLPGVEAPVIKESFVDPAALAATNRDQAAINSDIQTLNNQLAIAQQTFQSAQNDYIAQKSNFDNWIATRSATNSQATNPEVVRRNRELDALKSVEREAQQAVADVENVIATRYKDLRTAEQVESQLMRDAEPKFRRALHMKELRVFGFRLMLTLPLLLLAGWMVVRKRKSAYWPLYRGFVIFALFAFFVELVPYLPSYGGYVRALVGIIMVAVTGFFLIKWMRGYLARKQLEEARSEAERRESIDYETALKKIGSGLCPGCDRQIIKRENSTTNYCVHCGIHLQRECGNCQTRNVTFHKFCLTCGETNKAQPA